MDLSGPNHDQLNLNGMRHLFLSLLLAMLFSCGIDQNQEKSKVQEVKTEKPATGTETFDKELVTVLYENLSADFEIDFKQTHLSSILSGIKISSLYAGKEFEKEMRFEDFECACLDVIKISYSEANDRFILWVYEEFCETDFDWCSESSYSYSFQIRHREIIDLKLDFMAG
jgi:hypothetical protein